MSSKFETVQQACFGADRGELDEIIRLCWSLFCFCSTAMPPPPSAWKLAEFFRTMWRRIKRPLVKGVFYRHGLNLSQLWGKIYLVNYLNIYCCTKWNVRLQQKRICDPSYCNHGKTLDTMTVKGGGIFSEGTSHIHLYTPEQVNYEKSGFYFSNHAISY